MWLLYGPLVSLSSKTIQPEIRSSLEDTKNFNENKCPSCLVDSAWPVWKQSRMCNSCFSLSTKATNMKAGSAWVRWYIFHVMSWTTFSGQQTDQNTTWSRLPDSWQDLVNEITIFEIADKNFSGWKKWGQNSVFRSLSLSNTQKRSTSQEEEPLAVCTTM